MEGYLVTFFTQRNRRYQEKSLAEWIVEKAMALGVRGATLVSGQEGFGQDGRFRSGNFFDYEDSPLQVTLALTDDECRRLMACIKTNNIRVFYTKAKAEFGYTVNS